MGIIILCIMHTKMWARILQGIALCTAKHGASSEATSLPPSLQNRSSPRDSQTIHPSRTLRQAPLSDGPLLDLSCYLAVTLTEARLQDKSAQKPLLTGPQVHEHRRLFAVFLLSGPLSFNPDWIPWLIFLPITLHNLLLWPPFSVFSYLPGKNLQRWNPAVCLLCAYPWAAKISWRKIHSGAHQAL